MKDSIIKFVCSLIIFIILFSILGLFGTIESTYMIKNCQVTSIENDTITVIDDRHNEWKFYINNDNDIVIGDTVDLIMDNHHTDYTIRDDEVKRVI